MNRQSCGYQHLSGGCLPNGGVQFILRYRDQNDYCVGGKRITIYDDGHAHSTCSTVSEAEFKAILLYELGKYAEYCQWHAVSRLGVPLAPFTHPTAMLSEVAE